MTSTARDSAEKITARELAATSGVRHGFFTREGGLSQGLYASLNGGLGSADDPRAVSGNRERMAGELGVAPENLLSLYQIHSADVVTATEPWPAAPDQRPRADAMVSATPGLGLAIATADCGPVLFADAHNRVVGAAHAGWKGAFSGVLEATLAAMEALGAERARVTAVLGPTISQAAYEVGPEFIGNFTATDAGNARFFRPSTRDGHAMFDLPAYIGARLSQAGVGAFHDLGLCTYGDEARFFSYRRATHRGEADYGRLISAIALA